MGIFWQGLFHDLSKFLPSEFSPYANYFYGKKGSNIKRGRDETGYYKPTDTDDSYFDFAWLLHQKRNKHHWQWWILPEDEGGFKVLDMPRKYIKEMVCDWIGAGKAQGFFSPPYDYYLETRKWYRANKDKMQLSEGTRTSVENLINFNGYWNSESNGEGVRPNAKS